MQSQQKQASIRGRVPKPSPCLLLDKFAGRFSKRGEDRLTRQYCELLVVVPRAFWFARLLDFHQEHVVDHAAVFADIAVLGEHIVDFVIPNNTEILYGVQLQSSYVGKRYSLATGAVTTLFTIPFRECMWQMELSNWTQSYTLSFYFC